MALETRRDATLTILAALAVALPSVALGVTLSNDAGMCEDTVRAVHAIEDAPEAELASAVNAVFDSDMQCRQR